MTIAALGDGDRAELSDLAPLLRRVVGLEAGAVVRLRLTGSVATALVRLPFGVLVGRSVHTAERIEPLDVTVAASGTLDWLDGLTDSPPERCDHRWRGAVPPSAGWSRVDRVPDTVLRQLVRAGALTLKQAAEREGVPGAAPRAQTADELLDSVVLTVDDGGRQLAPVTLRTLSALTRMGFLRRGGDARVDLGGRWIRVVGEYGTVYLERPGAGLQVI